MIPSVAFTSIAALFAVAAASPVDIEERQIGISSAFLAFAGKEINKAWGGPSAACFNLFDDNDKYWVGMKSSIR